jgi:hypothetical protein
MAHFIETVVLDELHMGHGDTTVVGFETLVSPPGDPDSQPDPRSVFEGLIGPDTPGLMVEGREQLVQAVTFVIVNPRSVVLYREGSVEGWIDGLQEPPFSSELIEWVRQAVESPLIVAETSPVSKRSLAELSTMGATTGVYLLGGIPVLVVFTVGAGLLLLRGVRHFGGALWEGARPEVVEFGGDVARTYLDLIRERYGIGRRGPPGSP